MRVSLFVLLALNHDLPSLYFPSCWDYKCKQAAHSQVFTVHCVCAGPCAGYKGVPVLVGSHYIEQGKSRGCHGAGLAPPLGGAVCRPIWAVPLGGAHSLCSRQVDELYEGYCIQWRLRDGASNMQRAFSSCPPSRASRDSLQELGRSLHECTEVGAWASPCPRLRASAGGGLVSG
jgi:hypothetical protein